MGVCVCLWGGMMAGMTRAVLSGDIAADMSPGVDADTREWCEAVLSSPEPDLLFYNRIPKCASSTMLDLFRVVARKNSKLIAFDLDKKFWAYHPTQQLQEKLYLEVNKHIFRPSTKLIFNSHTGYFPFNLSSVKYQKIVEHTQVVRECETRQVSHFFYDLYDVMAAKRAAQSHHLLQHLQKELLLTNESEVEQC